VVGRIDVRGGQPVAQPPPNGPTPPGELLARLVKRFRPAVQVTTAGPAQRSNDRDPRQAGGPVRIRCPVEQFEGFAGAQVVEGLQGGGEELPQRRA
jgi:hypothetical protein